MTDLTSVDHAGLRVNQAVIILLNLLAFVFNWPWLAGLVAVMMLAGTALRIPGFGFIYNRGLRPLGVVKPEIIQDNPEPHRFAQGFGGVALLIGVVLLMFGAAGAGWGLVWLVIALAGLNLGAGFCVGCAVYYWLARMHIPGFEKAPPDGVKPGMRPRGDR